MSAGAARRGPPTWLDGAHRPLPDGKAASAAAATGPPEARANGERPGEAVWSGRWMAPILSSLFHFTAGVLLQMAGGSGTAAGRRHHPHSKGAGHKATPLSAAHPPPLPDDFARRIGRARSGISVDRRGGGPRRDRPVGVGGRTAARAAASGCAASASGGPPPARVGADQQTPALARSAADAGQRGPKKFFLATVATPCCDRQPMPVAPPQRPNVRLASVGRVSPPRIVYMMYVPSSLSGGLEEGDSLPRVPTENPFADPRTVTAARETTPSYLWSVPRRAPRRGERPRWTEPPSRLLFAR